MHRKGMNPDCVNPADILCDFCGTAAWAADKPCVEGHQGSIVCGDCLSKAYVAIILQGYQSKVREEQCRMCLEHRDESVWLGEIEPFALICKRCIKQAAGALTKSKAWDWTKPIEG